MSAATELTTAAFIYKRNKELLAKATDGLTEEQWTARPLGSCNSVLWLVGHVAWARSRALKLVGFTWTKPWLDLFARGSEPTETSKYPSVPELLDAWQDLCSSFPATLDEISHDVLAAPVQQPSPSFDGTVGGMVNFLAMHESYHVGQAVYARKLLGASGVVG
jgi:uncharacterized damage-inducible protein DinB